MQKPGWAWHLELLLRHCALVGKRYRLVLIDWVAESRWTRPHRGQQMERPPISALELRQHWWQGSLVLARPSELGEPVRNRWWGQRVQTVQRQWVLHSGEGESLAVRSQTGCCRSGCCSYSLSLTLRNGGCIACTNEPSVQDEMMDKERDELCLARACDDQVECPN